jgi:hypothetical protein
VAKRVEASVMSSNAFVEAKASAQELRWLLLQAEQDRAPALVLSPVDAEQESLLVVLRLRDSSISAS